VPAGGHRPRHHRCRRRSHRDRVHTAIRPRMRWRRAGRRPLARSSHLIISRWSLRRLARTQCRQPPGPAIVARQKGPAANSPRPTNLNSARPKARFGENFPKNQPRTADKAPRHANSRTPYSNEFPNPLPVRAPASKRRKRAGICRPWWPCPPGSTARMRIPVSPALILP
jgi:hypothetical protein